MSRSTAINEESPLDAFLFRGSRPHLDNGAPSGGPTVAVPLVPDQHKELIWCWDNSDDSLEQQRTTLGLDRLGRVQLERATDSLDLTTIALLRVHNRGFVSTRLSTMRSILQDMSLHDLMEPFLLKDEHQVIISISTAWATILLVVDGSGASSSLQQDPNTPYTLPDSIERVASPAGFLWSLQGTPLRSLHKRSWRPSSYKTVSLAVHITPEPQVLVGTDLSRVALWRWYLGPTALPRPLPSINIPPNLYCAWGPTTRPSPSSYHGLWRFPSSICNFDPPTACSRSATELYLYDEPQPPDWDLTAVSDHRPSPDVSLRGGALQRPTDHFVMTNPPLERLGYLRQMAIHGRRLPLVQQPSYLSISSTSELEWSLVRVGNEAYTYDSLCPTFVVLRCWSLADTVRPWTPLAGSRFKLMILGNRLTILISVQLSPLTSFSTDGRPGYMHISQAGVY